MSITAEVRARDMKLSAHVAEFGRRSLRTIAKALGMSKDTVARGLNAIDKRAQHPESHFWETPEGQAWLLLLFTATLYVFGLKGNQGAERMSEFFKLLRLDRHIGVSPTTLRTCKRAMEEALLEFQRSQEARQKEAGPADREIVASGDETWFNDQPVLVLMELASGYILVEEAAADRSYETWNATAQTRLAALGLQVRHFISDRGKALVKLATAGLGCVAGADIFHAQYGLSKWLGRSLHGKLGRATQKLHDAQAQLAKLTEKGASATEISAQQQRVQEQHARVEVIQAGKEAYSTVQHTISTAVHAFDVADNQPQSSEQVAVRLEDQAQQLEQIAHDYTVQDNKDALGKFRRQIEDVASSIDAWWTWTKESLAVHIGAELRQWLLYVLLPVIYWHAQVQKTRHPELRAVYETALHQAQAAYAAHPVTRTLSEQDLERWRTWAEWASGNFQRASSAVEGRNGVLSQSYHNGRGLTARRLGALTVIHNYDTRRSDGSTPAERLYGTQFPDVFEWLLEHMGDLPLPRQSRPRASPDPLTVAV